MIWKQTSRDWLALGVVCVVFAALLYACQIDEREAGDGAVTVYSGRTRAVLGPMVENFEKTTGIDVTVHYGDSYGIAERIQDGEVSDADIFLSAEASTLDNLADRELLATLPAEISDKVQEPYRGANRSWVGVTGRVGSLVYNPRLIKKEELPRSIFDLAEEPWRGKVAMAPGSNAFKGLVAGAVVHNGQQPTADFLTKLAGNQVGLLANVTEVFSEVEAGNFAIGLLDNPSWFRSQDPYNFRAVAVQPSYFDAGDTGSVFNICGAGILKASQGDKDARHFVGFLLSQETQNFFANYRFEYPLAFAAERPRSLPQLAEISPPAIDFTALPAPSDVNALLTNVGLRS